MRWVVVVGGGWWVGGGGWWVVGSTLTPTLAPAMARRSLRYRPMAVLFITSSNRVSAIAAEFLLMAGLWPAV